MNINLHEIKSLTLHAMRIHNKKSRLFLILKTFKLLNRRHLVRIEKKNKNIQNVEKKK